jgi:hypothetical protein
MRQSIYIFFVLLILFKSNVNGQQFEFTLYFEDSKGNTDSVILGFDNSATYELDTAFGEKDISQIPYDSVFEARGATYQYPLECNSLNNRDQLIFESKKLITYNSCDFNVPLEGKSAMVTIKSKYTPIKVTWDSTLFNTSCIKSYLVNWQPGGWFDACCCNGGSEIGLIQLNSNSSYTFSSTDFQFLTETDTVFTLFFPLSNDDIVGINHLTEENDILIYPNPLSGKGVLEFENTTNDLYRFTIYDNKGGIVAMTDKIRDNKFEFQLNDCSNGLYYYELINKRNKKRFSGKFIYDRK